MSPMKPNVTACRHGRDATNALARVLVEAKADDPFAKVTVLVPSNLAGLSARRLLGSGDLGGTGIANVDFVTPFRLAELLAPVRTPGRNPLTNPILAAAVRHVLATEPGRFAPVSHHEATEAALVDLYEKLSHALTETRSRISAADDHGRSLIEVFDRVRRVLSEHEGEDDLVEMAALHAEQRGDLAAVVGTLVWWLPEPVSPAVRALVRALVAAVPSTIVVAMTGSPGPDAMVRDALAQVGVAISVADIEIASADQIISVSDADEEVRAVVREVLDLVAQGVPLHRIGVFHPRPDPYARTLDEQLAAAEIAHTGPNRRRLVDLIAGRVLLSVLDLDRDGFTRTAVMRLCATGPLRDAGGFVPSGRWERASRQAGVVGGLDDWHQKLAANAEHVSTLISGSRDPDDAWTGRRRNELADLQRLAAFVVDLAAGRRVVTESTTWADKASAAAALLQSLLGPESRRLQWPDHERDAADRVDAGLSRLAVLDDIEPNPTDESFRRAVLSELDVTVGRIGAFGRGLVYGPLSSAVGQDLDAVFILGLAEGTCPAPRAEDPLLTDRLRLLAVAAELPTRSDELALQHRSFAAALDAAPAGSTEHPRRFLTYPRGDLRSNRDRIPSRWLLPTASRMAGRRVSTADFARLSVPGVRVVASFAAGLVDDRPATDLADHDAASVQRYVLDGGDPADHPVVAGPIARGLHAAASRDAPRFTEWDGDVAGAEIELPGTTRPASATRLQTWAECPFRYFLAFVLGLDDRDDPAAIAEIGALDRGSLLHEILEAFLRWAIADRAGGPPAPDETWSSADRAQLHEFADVRMADYERRGRTGRPLSWKMQQTELRRELDAWLRVDDGERAVQCTTPLEVEMAFGFAGRPALELTTDSGRVLRFHGYIDRVDRSETGKLHVYDYKSSKYDKYDGLAADPVEAGKTLQLGLYAEAVRAQHGAHDDVDARYWLATGKGRNRREGYPWTDDRRSRFLDVTEAIVEGIEAGAFPARPGEFDAFWQRNDNCGFCAFDSVCPKDRADHEIATLQDPRAARVVERLALPEQTPDSERDAAATNGDAS